MSTGEALRRVAIGLIAFTVLAWAVVLGWFLHDWLADDEASVTVDRPVQIYSPETVTVGRIPNVIGLTEEEARRALSDAGIELSAVSSHEIPYVGPPSLVVEQSPASGQPVEDSEIELAVSTPALMPDLNGESEAEAREALSTLGARISIANQYQPGASEGTVLSTDPPVGEPIVDKATLNVAEPLSSVFLTQLSPEVATCRTGEEGVVSGTAYAEAIVCEPELGAKPRSVTYTLGGQVESFEAVLGLDDGADPDVPIEFSVVVDGAPVLTRRLEFGDSLPVEVPLLGKLQLTLEASALGIPGSLPVGAVFGEPRLVGSRSAIDLVSEGLGG
ncbi:MAG: PASTA domain-containing protein [Solirubrobacterales bacterium]